MVKNSPYVPATAYIFEAVHGRLSLYEYGIYDDTPMVALKTWWALPESRKKEMGCGPGKVGDKLVPDTMWGLCVQAPCSNHDKGYEDGIDSLDKLIADVALLVNCVLRIVAKADPNEWGFWRGLKVVGRILRAAKYAAAVILGGKKAFVAGKGLRAKT